ncbi:MAG: antibiotic biosynthesis monooxygenase [Candidatus Limnocylindrales bacterium]
MFIAAVHVYVKPERVDDFKSMIHANHLGSIAEPGCLRFDVAQSKEDPTQFLLWECYVDEAAAAFHKTTPHYLAFKEQMPELMSRERRSDLFDGIYVASDKA